MKDYEINKFVDCLSLYIDSKAKYAKNDYDPNDLQEVSDARLKLERAVEGLLRDDSGDEE